MEQATMRKQKGQWALVDMEKLPVRPEVQRARDLWEGREIWFRMPKSGSWRRGKVKHIYNSGSVLVVVYQKGTPGLDFAFEIKHILLLLKLAGN
jgi:ribosomal protein L35AE/L33A